MDASDAKALLLRHLDNGIEDDTLLSGLRPYRGVQDRHLADILRALLAAAPGLNQASQVDRALVRAVWDLCRTVRAWTRGPHEPMFHGRHFIPPAEKRRLDSWVDQVESITLSLLLGSPIPLAFFGLPWYVVEWGIAPQAAFLAPLFGEMLRGLADEGSDGDDEVNLCRALGAMGPAARSAEAAIRTVGTQSKIPEVRAAAEEALRAIT